MSDRTSVSEYESGLVQAKRFLAESDDFLVVSHVNPDGDAISSTLIVGWLLDRLGKSYTMANQDAIPDKFRFLRKAGEIVAPEQLRDRGPFDCVVCVDCADRERIGAVSELIAPDARVLNIDHHPTNDRYGTVVVVDPDASATAEILFDLVQACGVPLDAEGSELVYTGLLTDTGGFRYSNTSAKVLRIAADLVERGVQGHVLAERLLETMTLTQLELLKRGLGSLSFAHDNRIAWIRIAADDLRETNATTGDVEGLVNYARSIAGVEAGLLFRQDGDDRVKVSFRSNGRIDVAAVAKKFGGGGHVRASGATVKGTMDEVVQAVVREVGQALP